MPAFLIMHGALGPFIGRVQSGRQFSALLAHQGATALQYVLLPEGGHGSCDFDKPETIEQVVSLPVKQFAS
ncbi:MAG: hypothetical protein OER56_16695 [Hyphomicrobiales bacterium]|nr:hypothetical protein [Hyphomicrobiales bacterium]